MSSPAAAALARIVQLVAELTRAAREGGEAPTMDALAAVFGVTRAQIAADIRTLTLLGDHADADWLLSLSAWQEGDRVGITSAGPFRRPVRLSPEELLAVRLALATEPGGPDIAIKLGALEREVPTGAAGARPRDADDVHALLAGAVGDRRRVTLRYAGEGEATPTDWLLEPHQVVEYRDRIYLVAWAAAVNGWRHFRLDRVLDARLAEGAFPRRPDLHPVTDPAGLFRAPAAAVDQVIVRFRADATAWARERYPGGVPEADGGFTVTLQASSVAWLVRRVLEHGIDAEVLAPPAYREAMRRGVGA